MAMEAVNELLDNKTALKSFIIGIGNAGNQLVNLAYQHGYDVFAINTSFKDLKNSIVDENIKSFIIGDDAKGAGKDRDYAKELFSTNGKDLFSKTPAFTEACVRSDILVVVGSTAGGTGSKLAPLILSILQKMYPNKICIYYGILPRKSEFAKAQYNSIECINEVHNLNIPYLLADLEYYNAKSNEFAFNDVAKHILDNIDTINGKYLNNTAFGMIDENDMRVVISEVGYMSIYNVMGITQEQIDAESVQSMLIKKIKKSPSVNIMRDGIIKQMASIINMPEEMSDSTKSSNYEELVGYIGRPLTVFENYAVTNHATGQMAIILSGQSMPYARITMMQEIVDIDKAKYLKKKEFDLQDMVNSNNVLKAEAKHWMSKDQQEDAPSLDDLFDNL